MLRFLKSFRKRIQTKPVPVRRIPWYRPHLERLEDRYLLAVSLSGPASGSVGTPGAWTATLSGDASSWSSPVFQFSVVQPNGTTQVVRDFSASNTLNWNTLQEGNYTIEVTAENGYGAASGESASASYTANSLVNDSGTSPAVNPSSNPLIALYSAPPPSSGSSMSIQFTPSANSNWQNTQEIEQTSSETIVQGQSNNFLVAGMLPNTAYLMREVVDGNPVAASQLTFTTGSLPTSLTFPSYSVQQGPTSATDTTDNMIYHVGLGGSVDLLSTDMAGNVNWYYDPVANNFYGYGPALVPGGTILMLGGTPAGAAGGYDTLREIDLLGDSLRQTNVGALNAQLAAMGQDPIIDIDHEALRLPNGDTAIIASNQKTINVNGNPTVYTGNEVLVLDQNFQVKWVWNAFDWMNPSRLGTDGEKPNDWLHANSISWSPEDGNLVVSLRAQDWVIKIDYSDGTGDGHIVWTLGAGGNFTLGNNPSDPSLWFTHQHDVQLINDNTLVVFDDGNTRAATNASAHSRGQEYVLNEQTMTATLLLNADLGNYSSALGGAQMLPNGNLDFTSGLLSTRSGVSGQSIEVSPDGSVNYVLQQNANEYRSFFVSNLYDGNNFDYGVLDSGFEDPNLGTGASAYVSDPAGLTWSFSGSAGIAGNGSTITIGNPNAPQGSQVAFLQGTGTISQAVNFFAGTYTIGFAAAQQANQAGSQTFEVEVDGTVVGTFTPSDTNYNTYTTNTFTVSAGMHTVTFVGLDGSGNTALIDAVSLQSPAPPPPPPNAFVDPNFAFPNVGTGSGAFAYYPIGSGLAWTYSGGSGNGSGVSGNGSGFTNGNPNAPVGTQVAFIQEYGSISQTVNFTAGTYTISVDAAQRGNYQASSQTFEVEVDGTVVGTITPSGASYASYTTNSFTVTAGNHTVQFVGLDPNGGDNTVFLDAASIQTGSPPPPPPPPPLNQFSDPDFATPNMGTGPSAYQYNPNGAPWTYSGTPGSGSGVSGNGSGFTNGNPNAPVGTQVAFIQEFGSITQTVSFTAGTYTISVDAAQRGNYQASSQTFEVEVDGTVVGTITPSGASYASYTTNSFTVTAGNHTVQFVGLDPNGGDNTVFLDAASIQTPSPPPPPPLNQFSDPGFAAPNVGSGSYADFIYNPSNSPWTFSTWSGVSGNGSGFTSGNPNAPEGTQVAFLQDQGSISQAVNFAAGSFTLSFEAAQRANYQATSQTFEVEVDGQVVGTFTPSGSSYNSYTTNAFTVSDGMHTVSFIGLDPNGGDNTAFIDQVSIASS